MQARSLSLMAAFLLPGCAATVYLSNLPASDPAIRYADAPRNDAITQLNRELAAGKRHLSFDPEAAGYLSSLLESLAIDPASQMLTFAKASFQAEQISPRNPRALYFNDEVAIGYVRNAKRIEIAAVDSQLGVAFYTLENAPAPSPSFVRQEMCLQCHQGPSTMGVPGVFIGSVFPNAVGVPSRAGAIITDHTTPIEDRWGGWFVSLPPGGQAGRGNSAALDPADPAALEPIPVNFSPHGYLNSQSDMVALMTFEHQTQAINLLTRLGWQARLNPSGSVQLDSDIQATARYLTFRGEATLHEPISPASAFSSRFPERGPRDRMGRSLRDFDLKRTLFRYPVSYMLYSSQFNSLPRHLRDRVYREIFRSDLGPGRCAAYRILRETRTDLPAGLCPECE